MELIWAFAKLLEYIFIVPLWWVATYLAAFVYPVEDDYKQDALAFVISTAIVIGLIFCLNQWMGGIPDIQQPAAQTEAAQATAPAAATPDSADIEAQAKTLELLNRMNAAAAASQPAATR